MDHMFRVAIHLYRLTDIVELNRKLKNTGTMSDAYLDLSMIKMLIFDYG